MLATVYLVTGQPMTADLPPVEAIQDGKAGWAIFNPPRSNHVHHRHACVFVDGNPEAIRFHPGHLRTLRLLLRHRYSIGVRAPTQGQADQVQAELRRIAARVRKTRVISASRGSVDR